MCLARGGNTVGKDGGSDASVDDIDKWTDIGGVDFSVGGCWAIGGGEAADDMDLPWSLQRS